MNRVQPQNLVTINSKEDLDTMSVLMTDLDISSDCCNDADLTVLDLTGHSLLIRMSVGVNSLKNVTKIDASDSFLLREMIVGDGSLIRINE